MVGPSQGEVWWAELPDPVGSSPGFRRPVVIVQGDLLNRSRLNTIIVVPLTSNLAWADALGNVRIPATASALPKDSVAMVSQILTIDRSFLIEGVGHLPPRLLERILDGVDLVLGR